MREGRLCKGKGVLLLAPRVTLSFGSVVAPTPLISSNDHSLRRELAAKLNPASLASHKRVLKRLSAGRKQKALGSAARLSSGSGTVQSQLAALLHANQSRVIDLFRDWDVDGDGQVTMKEFRSALRTLGYDGPREEADALFRFLDKDGSGSMDFKEIHRALRQGAEQFVMSPQGSARGRTPAPPPQARGEQVPREHVPKPINRQGIQSAMSDTVKMLIADASVPNNGREAASRENGSARPQPPLWECMPHEEVDMIDELQEELRKAAAREAALLEENARLRQQVRAAVDERAKSVTQMATLARTLALSEMQWAIELKDVKERCHSLQELLAGRAQAAEQVLTRPAVGELGARDEGSLLREVRRLREDKQVLSKQLAVLSDPVLRPSSSHSRSGRGRGNGQSPNQQSTAHDSDRASQPSVSSVSTAFRATVESASVDPLALQSEIRAWRREKAEARVRAIKGEQQATADEAEAAHASDLAVKAAASASTATQQQEEEAAREAEAAAKEAEEAAQEAERAALAQELHRKHWQRAPPWRNTPER